MTCEVIKEKDCVTIICRRGNKKQPRFSFCEKINCPDCYDCQEKLEVRTAKDIGAWGLDYYCPQKGVIVYKE